jgi:hypothetical protein
MTNISLQRFDHDGIEVIIDINFFITQFVDEIFYLKDRIKEIESKNSTLEEQIELMGGY